MEQEEKQTFYPLLIDISRYKCLVVGGGHIALEKVKNLLDFEADITIISPDICFELANLAGEKHIHCESREYVEGDASGYRLVFAATDDPHINAAVREECNRKSILVNVAEKPELSNIIIPSSIKESNFTISVATTGDAPFFTRKIREVIRKNLPENIGDIAYLAGEFRQKVLNDARFDTYEKKEDMYEKFMYEDWVSILEDSGFEGAFLKMAEILK